MASMKCKQMVAVVTLAASTLVMGGTAFAGNLVPDPAGKAIETARNTVGDGQHLISRLRSDPRDEATKTARNTVADGLNQVKKAFQ